MTGQNQAAHRMLPHGRLGWIMLSAGALLMTVLVEGAVLATGRPADVRANAAVQTADLGGHA